MLNIVLVEPEIPQNCGNIARTCAATHSVLHLIRPLGFDISDKAVKRAGLDYWHLVDVRDYENLDDFFSKNDVRCMRLFSTKAPRSYDEADYPDGAYLFFGKETKGLPEAFMHLLVIEDERALCETIVRSLRRLAYSVDCCYDGEKALELLGVERYDLVLLDLNLPGKDGMTVLRTLRQTDRETRVLILSARSEVEDKVEGLDAGANDYLAKPFHLAELEARIRSLTLRQFTQQDVLLTCGDLAFDTRSRTASVNAQALTLTRKETGILEYLMVHQGRPVSQEELMDHVWDNSVDSFSNSIRVHISALRKKLRAALGYDPIRNRIGEGYLMGGEET